MELTELRRRVPFLGFSISLMLGILCYQTRHHAHAPFVLSLAVLLWLPPIVYHIRYKKWASRKRNKWFRVFMLISIAAIGWLLARSHDRSIEVKQWLSEDAQFVLFRVDDAPVMRKNSFRVEGSIVSLLRNNGAWEHPNLGSRIYWRLDSGAVLPQYGDLWLMQANLQLPDTPLVPFQFNLRQYLAHQATYIQSFVGSKQVLKIGEHKGNKLKGFALSIQQQGSAMLDSLCKDPVNAGILKALLLGYRYDLNEGIARTFSKAGVMHVLAVSGLHVGALFVLLRLLLIRLKRHSYGGLLYLFAILSGLWLFALITGLSPSVSRAALMFSIVQIGLSMRRRIHVLNSLAVSAFVLLLFEPFLLYQVGFQFSYAAVLGIVALSRSMEQLLPITDWFVSHLWQLTCVSVAAQIGTFALGIYYFHQFSVWFLPANLLVIPLITIVLYGGIVSLFFVLLGFDVLASWFIWLVESYLHFMRFAVSALESLPSSSLSNLFLSAFQVLLISLMILFAIGLKSINWKLYLIGMGIVFLLYIGHFSVLLQERSSFRGRFGVGYGRSSADIYAQKGLIVIHAPARSFLADPEMLFYTSGLKAYLNADIVQVLK